MPILAADPADWSAVYGAAVGATITGLFAVFVWWLGRRRPNKVLVREAGVTSLVRIAKSVRADIATTFKGSAVTNLSQVEFNIQNVGHDPIESVALIFTLPADTAILGHETGGPDGRTSGVLRGPAILEISLRYLNPYRDHREAVTLKIVCDGPVAGWTVAGSGRGWSTQSRRLADDERRGWRLTYGFIALALAFAITGMLTGIIFDPPQISDDPTRRVANLVSLSCLIGSILMIAASAFFLTGRLSAFASRVIPK